MPPATASAPPALDAGCPAPLVGAAWELANNCDPGARRRALWSALRTLWKVSTNRRHAYCRRFLHGDLAGIEKRLGRASYTGLQTCGWYSCPCCGPKIAIERATDIALALSEHHARGGRVALVTLTMRHTRAQRLSDLLDGLGGAWQSVRQTKASRALLAARTDGFIKRLEVTVGPNGWHPHLHVLVFLTAGVTDDQAHELGAAMFTPWSSRLVRAGLGEPTEERGIVCEVLNLAAAHEKVADYVAKSAALELASAGTKLGRRAENRTTLQLLHDVGTLGLADDLARWHEYEQAIRGRRAIQWSLGLRRRLLGDLQELTDEEAAEANDGAARLLGCFTAQTWERITESRFGPATVLSWAEVYDDEDEARELVARQLARHGLGDLLAAMAMPPGGLPVAHREPL